MRHAIAAAALAAALAGAVPAAAEAATLIALTADGRLVRVDAETGRASAPVAVRGADGRLLGVDVRPKDGRLYGLTERGQVVTLDPATGAATPVSRLSVALDHGGRAVVDFNPVADRLRVMGLTGQNLRVDVDTGAAASDGALKYQPGTPLAGTAPRVTAGAYTNSAAGATATALYTLDALAGSWNLQAPPNDGVQQPKGVVAGLPPGAALDILADGSGGNVGYLLADGALHTVAPETGASTGRRAVAGLPAGVEVVDIAAMR